MKDPKIQYYENKYKTYWKQNRLGILVTVCVMLAIFLPFATCQYLSTSAPDKPKTTAEIKKEVTEFVKPVQAKIDSFKQVIADSSKALRTAEQRLYAAEQELRRLKSKKPVFNNPDSSRSMNTLQSVNGTAQDYTDLSTACENYVTEAKGVINNLHSQLDNKDSIITQSELQTQIFRKGFNDMAQNSQEKDRAIRDLNRKLRVKKVTGFVKTAAIVAAVVYVIVKK